MALLTSYSQCWRTYQWLCFQKEVAYTFKYGRKEVGEKDFFFPGDSDGPSTMRAHSFCISRCCLWNKVLLTYKD